MNKLLTRLAGPLCIIVDLAILVDLAIDIHHKIKTRRRAREMEDDKLGLPSRPK